MPIPKKCPACSSDLVITRLTCSACGTEVNGSYLPDLFSRLSPNDFEFILLFVKTKGNIKEMERLLGISYWTIRSKLNEIVQLMEAEAAQDEPGDPSVQRQQILEQLNTGLITVPEAAERLERLRIKR
jgi:hypothetical protein